MQTHFETPACWDWPLPSDDLVEQCSYENGLLLFEWQDGHCAVCGSDWHKLVEDHDHKTGLVRGYLCRRCNSGEGRNREPDTIYSKYRNRNPASILGIREVYTNIFGKTPMHPPPMTPERMQQLQELVDRCWSQEETEE